MTTRVDVEQIETTRSEKVLAFVLAAFLIVGGIWAYVKIDEIGEPQRPSPVAQGVATDDVSPADRQAVAAKRRAQFKLNRAERQRSNAVRKVEFAREEYRASLDAGEPSASLEAAYREAQAELESAASAVARAQAELDGAARAAAPAEQRIKEAEERRNEEERDHDRQTFLLRLVLIAALLGGSYLLLGSLRRRRSPYLPLGLAAVGASAVVALYMAGDYGFDTIEFEEVGPLAISLMGIATTTAAFIALQRYVARRIPLWRVKRGDCPFCGHPVRGNRHCEGCGRQVVAPCAKCEAPRRVGSEHCGACGAA